VRAILAQVALNPCLAGVFPLEQLLEQGYTAGRESQAQQSGPSADEFWGGEPVGAAESGSASGISDAASAARTEPV